MVWDETGIRGVMIYTRWQVRPGIFMLADATSSGPIRVRWDSEMMAAGSGTWDLGLCCQHPARSLGVPCLCMASCSGWRLGVRACRALTDKEDSLEGLPSPSLPNRLHPSWTGCRLAGPEHLGNLGPFTQNVCSCKMALTGNISDRCKSVRVLTLQGVPTC